MLISLVSILVCLLIAWLFACFFVNYHNVALLHHIKNYFDHHFETEYFFKCYFSNVNLFMFSYFEPNFIEKNPLGKGFLLFCFVFLFCFLFFVYFCLFVCLFVCFFQIFSQNKNWLFGRHFETVQRIFFFFSRIMNFYSAYIYGANFIAKFWWESGFLRGFHLPWNPLDINGSESTLVT